MNFDQKISSQFSNFILGLPNHPKHLYHLFADYVELIAVFSNESFVSVVDVLDRLNDEGFQISEHMYSEDDEIGSLESEIDDYQENWMKSIFSILQERSRLYRSDYPFEFYRDDTQKEIIYRGIKLKTKVLSGRQKVYLQLLISSNLNFFNKLSSELTSEFETISYHVLKNFLPPHATIKQFGKNSDYNGTAAEKIESLARDLNIEINKRELANLSLKNTQERGLDIIGWIPFEDKNPNMIVILGQCACGKNWFSKKTETHRYLSYLKFYKLRPLHALFIPYSLINSQGFHQSDEIQDHLIFSRKRILEFLGDTSFFDLLKSKLVIEKCINYEEDVV